MGPFVLLLKKERAKMVHHCNTANEVIKLKPQHGDIAVVYGRITLGDSQWIYRYDEGSELKSNDGTVLDSVLGGRWLLCHDGSVDFRVFGIFDNTVNADDALESMVNDITIKNINAKSALNFVKRHKFYRNNLKLDFNNFKITTHNVEPAMHNDPFGAILHFCGKTNQSYTHTLKHNLNEQYDIFEVPDSAIFKVGTWWQVSVNKISGREEKEIDKLLCVSEQIDKNHVRFQYKMGWQLEIGRTLTFTKINPVENIEICNMQFYGNIGGEECGAHSIALEYAVRCNVRNVRAKHTYWPVILRRHNTEYITEQCSLVNPTEVMVGGTGYLTQQIHCLYGNVRDCTCSNARHLNDFTGSAYCMVQNCHADGDFHGAFVTHGQFEHDLLYLGNSGLLSFANSGPTWGSSAKRITVERHVGCWAIGFAKISDLTLRDVAICKTEKYEQCGNFLMNADGLQMQGCTGDELVLTQRSSRSKRRNVIRDCYFKNGISVKREGVGAVSEDTVIIYENNT